MSRMSPDLSRPMKDMTQRSSVRRHSPPFSVVASLSHSSSQACISCLYTFSDKSGLIYNATKNIFSECIIIVNMNKPDWTKIIAAYEIIGGAIGLGIVSFLAASMLGEPAIIVICLFFALLFILSIYAGVLLWRKDIRGIDLSIIAQIPQILHLTIPGLFSYSFVSGLSFPLIIEIESAKGSISFDFSLEFGSSFDFQSRPSEGVSGIGINLIPMAAIIYLYGLRTKGFPVSPVESDIGEEISGMEDDDPEREEDEKEKKTDQDME